MMYWLLRTYGFVHYLLRLARVGEKPRLLEEHLPGQAQVPEQERQPQGQQVQQERQKQERQKQEEDLFPQQGQQEQERQRRG
jgi:hypothetical protein